MNCPGCGVEMVNVESDELTLRNCGECGGLWMDVSDLNRMLLHNNLPGLESLGGKLRADELTGQCGECLVDMVQIEGGDKQNPLDYDTCESCGGVFLEAEFKDITDVPGAEKLIIDFFCRFAPQKAGRKQAAS